jgi:uncharacterized protein (TIGR02246 family)
MEKIMGKFTSVALVASALTLFVAGAALAQSEPAAKIEAVLDAYETALNASDAAAVAPLYTADGVFMPPNVPAQIGTDAILAAYTSFFQTISFDLDFVVDEVVVASDDWAFARTHSTGTGKIVANGATVPQGNQELFVFQRDESGEWKIARYAFNSTLAAN